MRYRDYKQFAAGNYYHVYNRGNGGQNIFLDKQDYELFLLRLQDNLFPTQPTYAEGRPLQRYVRKSLPRGAFSLICYCLMTNHFHFLIRQNSALSISQLILKLCTSYSMCFNKKNNHSGHLFQDRFKAVPVESNSYLLWLSAYIHQNPEVAGLVKDLTKYPWSSYLDFIGLRNSSLIDAGTVLSQFADPSDYKKFVDDSYNLIIQRKDLKILLLDKNAEGAPLI